MTPDGYTIEHYQINITDEIMNLVAFYCCIISGCANFDYLIFCWVKSSGVKRISTLDGGSISC